MKHPIVVVSLATLIFACSPVNSGVAIAPLAASICGIWLAIGAAGKAAIAALTGGAAAAAIIPILSAGATSWSSCMILVGGIAAVTCFDTNAMVQTPRGNLPIQALAAGDALGNDSFVTDIAVEKGNFTFLEISWLHRGRQDAINVTANHLMLVQDSGEVLIKPAMSLGLGDKMVTTDGAGVIITKIRPLTKPEKIILRTVNQKWLSE